MADVPYHTVSISACYAHQSVQRYAAEHVVDSARSLSDQVFLCFCRQRHWSQPTLDLEHIHVPCQPLLQCPSDSTPLMNTMPVHTLSSARINGVGGVWAFSPKLSTVINSGTLQSSANFLPAYTFSCPKRLFEHSRLRLGVAIRLLSKPRLSIYPP